AVLEQTGLILEAGRQAIAAATGANRRCQSQGLEPPRIAVNVSQLQLLRKTFVEDVCAALRAQDADGGGVDLEITESLLMHDVDESICKLAALRDFGLRISLDDFGTGFSSLARCAGRNRSEEHTSELQSPCNLVCRLLLEKKKKY